MIDLPRYQCHKQVGALKISGIEFRQFGEAVIAFENHAFEPITAIDYRNKFHGSEEDLGYYVKYDDGYESWSPTKAFEEGYFRV